MNNTTSPSNFTCEIPSEAVDTVEQMVVICMLSVFSVVGTIGNGLVIYVYTRKKDKLTSSVFILALAGTDFFTCLVIIPYTTIVFYLSYVVYFDILCHIYIFLITFNVPLSAFIMVAIAVDRYLCICHPFLHLFTKRRAKLVLLILCLFASLLGVLSAISHSVHQTLDDILNLDPCFNTSSICPDCDVVYTGICQQSTKNVPAGYIGLWQKIYSSFFMISLIIVLTLYTIIYHSVALRRSKRRKQKAKKFTTALAQTEMQNTSPALNGSRSKEVNLKVELGENGTSAHTVSTTQAAPEEQSFLQKRNHTVKERKDHDRLANIKTAIMLFIVAIVFICAFLPAWLMALEIVKLVNIIFYSYFVYNVVNPIIYAFLNKTFRDDIKKICSR